MANSKRYNQETKEKQKLVSEESPLQSAGRRKSLSCTALEENMMQDAKIKYAEGKMRNHSKVVRKCTFSQTDRGLE